jgi:hypothetical protein
MLRITGISIAAAMFASTAIAAAASGPLYSPALKLGAPYSVLVKNNGGGGGGHNYTCEGLQCTCTGDIDCNDMFSDGVCGDIASCNDDVCKCLKFKKVPKTPKTRGVVGDPGVKVK